MLTVGSLFAGIGGFDLGLERAGMQVKWQVEIDPYCLKVLEKHWPHVRRYTDIKTVDWPGVEPVDLVCGGFPCQDISNLHQAGRGLSGVKSGLWSEYKKAIIALTPKWVVIENVAAIRSKGLWRLLHDLDEIGYDAEWHCIPAGAVGAPFPRDRAWVMAYPHGQRQQACVCQGDFRASAAKGKAMESARPSYGDFPTWNAPEPVLPRVAHGIPARVDRNRALGNAVVPQVVEWIGKQIIEAEALMRQGEGEK